MPYTGVYKDKFYGQKTEGNVLNGRKHGIWVYKTGNSITSKVSYENNLIEGECILYHNLSNSRMRLRNFKDLYYWLLLATVDKNRLHYIEKKSYYKSGMKEGADTSFHWDKIVSSIHHYSKGKLNGEVTRYYWPGRVSSKEIYVDDKIHGLAEYFDTAGFRITYLNYVKNLPDGEYRLYHDNKNLKVKGKFDKGKKIGNWKIYYRSGKLMIDLNIEKNIEDVDTLSFYNFNGGEYAYRYTVDFGDTYEEGTGSFARHYENGNKVYEGRLDNSRRVGMWNYWDENGSILKKIDYSQGIFIYSVPEGKQDSVFYQGKFTSYYANGNKELEALVMERRASIIAGRK